MDSFSRDCGAVFVVPYQPFMRETRVELSGAVEFRSCL